MQNISWQRPGSALQTDWPGNARLNEVRPVPELTKWTGARRANPAKPRMVVYCRREEPPDDADA